MFDALVLTATRSENFNFSVKSKELFNFQESIYSNIFIIEVRAAIPLSNELVSQVLLSGKEAFMLFKSRKNTITTGLMYPGSERTQDFNYSNFTQFTNFRFEVNKNKNLIVSSWSLSETLDEHRKNLVYIKIGKRTLSLKNERFVIRLHINRPRSPGIKIQDEISGSSCNAFIIDYIRVQNFSDSDYSNNTQIFDNSTDNRTSQICELISFDKDGNIIKNNLIIDKMTIIFVCSAIFVMILIISLLISIFKLFKERKKTNQARLDELYADFSEIDKNLEKDKDNEEINEYETVCYDKIVQDNQEYLEITEVEI